MRKRRSLAPEGNVDLSLPYFERDIEKVILLSNNQKDVSTSLYKLYDGRFIYKMKVGSGTAVFVSKSLSELSEVLTITDKESLNYGNGR